MRAKLMRLFYPSMKPQKFTNTYEKKFKKN